MTKSIVMVAIASIASFALVSCGSTSASEPNQSSKKVDSSISVNVNETVTQGWVKDSTVSDMGDKNIFYTVDANEKVHFDFPYEGGSTGRLIVRKKNGELGAMFAIDKGQIDTDYDGTYIRIKFDDEQPIKWSMGQAADGSSDILFFNNESKFVNKLKNSKKVVVEVPFFQNGNKQFTFNTQGLQM